MPIVTYVYDPATHQGLSEETKARLDAMTPEEIEANALSDSDNPPWTEEELERGRYSRFVRRTREATGLTQAQFAETYRINLARLRDAERGRYAPDSALEAYILLIRNDPEGVRHVLETQRAA